MYISAPLTKTVSFAYKIRILKTLVNTLFFIISKFSGFGEKEIQIKTLEKCWSFFLLFNLQGSSVKVWSSHEMRYVVAIYDVKMICTPKNRRYRGGTGSKGVIAPPPPHLADHLTFTLPICIWNVSFSKSSLFQTWKKSSFSKF